MTSVIALSILGGGTALAAVPNWSVGGGTDSSVAAPSGASTSTVTAGEQLHFNEWIRNNGSGNISQLYLTSGATNDVTGKTLPTTVLGASWIKVDALGNQTPGTCPVATPLACSFGALNAGATLYLSADYTVGGSVADGTVLRMTFEFNTSGVALGKNQSHGDAKQIIEKINVANGNPDAAGDYNNFDATQGTSTVSDVTKLTGKNTQGTSASVFASQVGVAVGDSPALQTPCDPAFFEGPVPDGFSCTTSLTSLTSVVEVGNGKDFHNSNAGNTPGIKVIINFAKSPDQLGGASPFVYHYWRTYFFDANGVVQFDEHAEFITDPCNIVNGAPDNQGPCLIVGFKQVTVWLIHNGGMRT
jgi:hypothetical protein